MGKVITLCGGHKDEWQDRELAIRQFVEWSCCSEGSERERYTSILLQLLSGKDFATDGEKERV